jgi:hypothetical protein
MRNTTKLDYETNRNAPSLQGQRVIRISDSVMIYYAVLPADMTDEDGIDDFVTTYDFNGDDKDQSREELESELRADIHAEVFDSFDPEAGREDAN